jgi:hypothetical protein
VGTGILIVLQLISDKEEAVYLLQLVWLFVGEVEKSSA